MRREVTSKSIQGISDLVVRAPIKKGFISAFENVTYETRLRLATRAFNDLRVVAREYETIKPFADVAERIQTLLAFRIGVLDTQPQPSMILAATFDHAWEPYIRFIWNPLGVFLDVLLCNCEGYVTARDHSFPEYAKWVRDHQVDSDIFYATTPLTVSDQLYLIKLEQLQRAGRSAGDDLALAQMTADDPILRAKDVRDSATLTPNPAGPPTLPDPVIRQKFLTLAGEALVVLYRLADYYPPDQPDGDGKYLRRAAQDLFKGWVTTDQNQLPLVARSRFDPMFDWLETDEPPAPAIPPDPVFKPCEVQGGVLSSYDRKGAQIKHGCLLLFSVTDAGQARAFIAGVSNQISWSTDVAPTGDLGAFVNLAVTYKGLGRLGVPEEIIQTFPKEFHDGLDARATQMGDTGFNHPRYWPLPERFTAAPDDFAPRVELSEVDFILQLRTTDGCWDFIDLPNDAAGLAVSKHPLAAAVRKLRDAGEASGARLVSVEPLRRMRIPDPDGGPSEARDHFGFNDMISQPIPTLPAPTQGGTTHPPPSDRDFVKLGELLLGYANDRGDPPGPVNPFLRDGTFLVIRKMSQDVGALNDFLCSPPGDNVTLTGDDLIARMAGRTRGGVPLIPVPPGGYFDYSGDPTGSQCPFQAHIRRANPRVPVPAVPDGNDSTFGRPTPRLMRRGMSYGPDFKDTPGARRGVVFMGYCASIAEQFETIQRWINGGNSTGVSASQNDPLIGVQPLAGPKTFRFANGAGVQRVDMAKPFVAHEWGLYLFVPSRTALTFLTDGPPRLATIGDPERGETIIQSLSWLPQDEGALAWKTYLEDFLAKDPAERADTPDIWAAIRENHQGALRTPQGVLVASERLIDEVFLDPHRRYSVSGQGERMRHSFGEIFIGLDPGPQYYAESMGTNAAIMGVTKSDAFSVAYQSAASVLNTLAQGVAQVSHEMDAIYPAELDLRRDFITPTLGFICNYWFGLPDLLTADPTPGAYVQLGDWNWESPARRLPQCPGDYMAPSRYCFYPDPTPAIAGYGKVQGQALRAAAKRYVDALRPPPGAPVSAKPPPAAPLTQAMLDAIPDNDLVARTLIGTMTGALPPIDGNLRAALYEWLEEKTLWRFQRTLFPPPANPFDWAVENLESPMKAAMQKRPAPDLLWRTAVEPHWLGEVDVQPGEKVILSVVSATLENQNTGLDDISAVFGGRRSDNPHPVHACPAYEMAIGTMLGILTALFQAGEIQALPQPFLIKISRFAPQAGSPPPPAPSPTTARSQGRARPSRRSAPDPSPTTGPKRVEARPNRP